MIERTPRGGTLSRPAIVIDSFTGFSDLWSQTRQAWSWSCLFVLPFWLEVVWRHLGHLGAGGEPYIVTVQDRRLGVIGSLPLIIEGTTASFLGHPAVCDYQDLISAPGRQRQVLEAVLEHVAVRGIRRLDLRTLRPDSLTLDALAALSPRSSKELLADEVSFETDLPRSWEAFLQQLDGKQRHEVRRKLRRLETHGTIAFRCVSEPAADLAAEDHFLALFRANRPDKAAFMTPVMEACFRQMMRELAARHMLRLGFLDLNERPVASVLCIDYGATRYLYNSGYDEQFDFLGVGALSKALSIRDAIGAGCRRYDFLKGAEVYKKRLGGKMTELYRCTVEI